MHMPQRLLIQNLSSRFKDQILLRRAQRFTRRENSLSNIRTNIQGK
jgi:hypothetical protein